ncbi:unnamed protein product, partial [Brassica oleracea var. botrytis]
LSALVASIELGAIFAPLFVLCCVLQLDLLASLACRFNSSIDFQLKTFEHDVLCLLELEALVFHLHELFTIGGFARRL